MDKKALTETDIRTKYIHPQSSEPGGISRHKSLKNTASQPGALWYIAGKVDELFALCDQLKEQLQQASKTEQQLTSAIVEQALS